VGLDGGSNSLSGNQHITIMTKFHLNANNGFKDGWTKQRLYHPHMEHKKPKNTN